MTDSVCLAAYTISHGELEWADFLRGLAGAGTPYSLGREALETIEWIYRFYRAAAEKRSVRREESLNM